MRRLWRAFVLILVFGLAIGVAFGGASAWVFYHDDRLPSHLRMVGRITVDLPEGRTEGTAFLVDRCGILTNFHVVFGPWTVTVLRPPSHDFQATFTLTEADTGGKKPSSKATPVLWGNYIGAERQIRKADQDWTYLVLDDCLGSKYGYLRLSGAGIDALLDEGEQFAAVGYSAGRQMIDPHCRIARNSETRRRNGLGNDCVMMAGDSGSPIMKRGSHVVAALGSGYLAGHGNKKCLSGMLGPILSFEAGCSNMAVGITRELIERIRQAGETVSLQRTMSLLHYDVGNLGHIDAPRFVAAREKLRQEFGAPSTISDCVLEKMLKLLQPMT